MTTFAYVVFVFPIAIIWHLVLFHEKFVTFGYFKGDPNIAIGLLTMIVQGATIAMIYPNYRSKFSGLRHALSFGMLVGVFYWSCHVLGLVAKQNVPLAWQFTLMETAYLVVQFAGASVILWLVYGDKPSRHH
ncbi:hypothetical protein [Aestuariibius sp. HNIBRBA575]|uniref:hypothetical protein n=1 Tax=Aestuariibius sp. HNIBRBA575 TaxID=3233343 RepID=UPI0034A38482